MRGETAGSPARVEQPCPSLEGPGYPSFGQRVAGSGPVAPPPMVRGEATGWWWLFQKALRGLFLCPDVGENLVFATGFPSSVFGWRHGPRPRVRAGSGLSHVQGYSGPDDPSIPKDPHTTRCHSPEPIPATGCGSATRVRTGGQPVPCVAVVASSCSGSTGARATDSAWCHNTLSR